MHLNEKKCSVLRIGGVLDACIKLKVITLMEKIEFEGVKEFVYLGAKVTSKLMRKKERNLCEIDQSKRIN